MAKMSGLKLEGSRESWNQSEVIKQAIWKTNGQQSGEQVKDLCLVTVNKSE